MLTGVIIILIVPPITAGLTMLSAAALVLDMGLNFNSACFRVIHTKHQTLDQKHATIQFLRLLMLGQNSDSLQMRCVNAFTFEQLTSYEEKTLKEPKYRTCYKEFHIFFTTQENQRDFSLLTQKANIAKSSWLVFFIGNHTEKAFFDPIAIPYNTHLLTAVTTATGFQINEIFRITPKTPIEINKIGSWHPSYGLHIASYSMYHRRSNLNGLVFRIGSIDNWPVSGFSTINGSLILDGFFPRVWKELEECMNFRSTVYRSVDNATGTRENGKWNGLIGMLMRNEIDVIVSELNINLERTEVLDFPHPLLRTHYQVFYKMPGYNLSWTAVLEPFDASLWFALIGWILAGAITLGFCYKTSRPFEANTEIHLHPTRSLFFIFQSLCQQGYWQIPESYACRIIFLLAYIMSAIIIPSYAGSLISSLTAQTPHRPFDSLSEMLRFHEYKLLVSNQSAEYELFAKATDPFYARIFKELVISSNKLSDIDYHQSLIEQVCKTRLALFGVQSTFESRIAAQSSNCHIIKFSKPLSTVYQGLGFPKSSPYNGLANFHLGRLFDVGIIERLHRSVWRFKVNRHAPAFQQVSSSQVFQIFVCLAAGMVMSLLILLFEILQQKRNVSSHESHR